MKPIFAAFALSLTFAAGAANAGGLINAFPTLTYPEPQPIVTQDCVDMTSLGAPTCLADDAK
ncbi:hypothetical protein [Aestuariibius sp. HNIBRBA575]|uniref:hypothetical protein n=1 Tax=Aestuariibius sp. HNIBRBA575 TaxID=3233343 RepID=UPI0034A346EB